MKEAFNMRNIQPARRAVFKRGAGLSLLSLLAAAGWLPPEVAVAADAAGWNRTAFDARSLDDAMKGLDAVSPAPSKDVTFVATPDIAENGAVVPVTVVSAIPSTQSIAILIEKNPNMLAAVFDLPAGTDPSITTRVKMAQTSNVYALVKAGGRFYVAHKEIKVTLGGCGG
jgi:sulfur-oxidizing protein SoxY